MVKKIDNSRNTVTVVPNGTDTVEDDSSLILSYQGDCAPLLVNGTNWEVT